MAHDCVDETARFVQPEAVLFVGWNLDKRLKQIEQIQWTNQKLVEKRLALYDAIMPGLNDLYCFYNFIGHWKELSPPEIVAIKRKLDRLVYVNAPLLPEEFSGAYKRLMDFIFKTYGSQGEDAKINASIASVHGDRTKHAGQWENDWKNMFVPTAQFDPREFDARYSEVVKAFQSAIGVIDQGHVNLHT